MSIPASLVEINEPLNSGSINASGVPIKALPFHWLAPKP